MLHLSIYGNEKLAKVSMEIGQNWRLQNLIKFGKKCASCHELPTPSEIGNLATLPLNLIVESKIIIKTSQKN
jgi:hypothetical protein